MVMGIRGKVSPIMSQEGRKPPPKVVRCSISPPLLNAVHLINDYLENDPNTRTFINY